MKRSVLVTFLVWLSMMIAATGVFFVFGLGWSLIAGGVASAAVLATLVDVEEAKT